MQLTGEVEVFLSTGEKENEVAFSNFCSKTNKRCCSQAAANTRLVGLEVANLIGILVEEHEAEAEDFHIIGHSLGAHIAGYAGERVPGLGRWLKKIT